MLKGMKRGLIAFIFLAGCFLFKPNLVLAAGQACCSTNPNAIPGTGERVYSVSNNACCLDESCLIGVPSAIECGLGETCDPKNSTCVASGIDSTCPPGTHEVDPGVDGSVLACLTGTKKKCCYGNGGVCLDKESGQALVGGTGASKCPYQSWGNLGTNLKPDCDCVLNSGSVFDKDYCTNKNFRYSQSSNKCENFTGSSYNIDPFITCDPSSGQTVGSKGVQSAIGCIPTGDLPAFLAFILKFALGAAGGITVLMFIATGYTLITSTGNPEKLQAVKENLVSIFSGLIMIGFSLVLLQTIGAGVLKLPGF